MSRLEWAKPKKIGLFGGTFDPLHFAHLNLAMELKEKRELDEVWFIPAKINPHKYLSLPVSSDHRLAMLKLALKNYTDFIIKDLELHRDPPSYSVDTIRLILSEENKKPNPREFYWLMGEDGLYTFEQWHQPEEIVKIIPLLIGTRSLEKAWESQIKSPTLLQAIKKGLTKVPLLDISGTALRLRLSRGLICNHLIPSAVLSYIKQNQLYIEPLA